MPGWIGLGIFRVKEMRTADAAECAQRSAQVLMISGREDTAAALSETRDALAVYFRQTIARIDRKKPQLVKV